MLSLSEWMLFLGSSALVTLSPGPDNLYVVSLGSRYGKWPALLAAWGMVSGLWIHTALVAFGFAVLLEPEGLVYQGVRILGGLYLVFIGILMVKDAFESREGNNPTVPNKKSVYFRGFFMNLTNPKVTLFFLAFLPQFVPEETYHFGVWTTSLGILFFAQAFVIFSCIAVFAGKIGERINSDAIVGRCLLFFPGLILVLLGSLVLVTRV